MSGSQVLQPNVTITLANADAAVSNSKHKVLMVGQKVAAGTATTGSLITNLSSTGAPEDALFGRNSMLAEMVRAFKRVNKVSRLDCIPLDDAAGTARDVSFTVAVTTALAGTITVTVGSALLHEFVVDIAAGDTATEIADAITLAVNADTTVGFLASNAAGVMTFLADNLGTVYNDLGFEVVVDAGGVSVAAVTEDVAGATDPTEVTSATLFDVATDRYQGVVWPYKATAATTIVRNYLSARENPANEILDGVAFSLTQAAHATALTDVALNDKNLVFFADETISESLYLGPAQNEASFVKLAYFAAIRALRLTEGASIASVVTTGSSLDQFGGTALASLPYFNTPLTGLLPTIKAGRGWTNLEVEQLLAAGGSVMGVNSAGTGTLTGEIVTTWLTDAAGNPDPTFTFLNYVDTGRESREYMHNNLRSRFAQSRLTEGAVTRGRDMANREIIRAFVEKLYQDLSGPDFVLVQGGSRAVEFFKDNLTVVLDLETGTVTITMLVPIVTQLRAITATMNITFSTAG